MLSVGIWPKMCPKFRFLSVSVSHFFNDITSRKRINPAMVHTCLCLCLCLWCRCRGDVTTLTWPGDLTFGTRKLNIFKKDVLFNYGQVCQKQRRCAPPSLRYLGKRWDGGGAETAHPRPVRVKHAHWRGGKGGLILPTSHLFFPDISKTAVHSAAFLAYLHIIQKRILCENFQPCSPKVRSPRQVKFGTSPRHRLQNLRSCCEHSFSLNDLKLLGYDMDTDTYKTFISECSF